MAILDTIWTDNQKIALKIDLIVPGDIGKEFLRRKGIKSDLKDKLDLEKL